MKIALGADRMGFLTKEYIKQCLVAKGYMVADCGTLTPDNPITHLVAADRVSEMIRRGECHFGILICRTGMGISIAANKHMGIYCALCESTTTARESRRINNCNVLAIGGGIVDRELAMRMVEAFLYTTFADGESPERCQILQEQFDELKRLEFQKLLYKA